MAPSQSTKSWPFRSYDLNPGRERIIKLITVIVTAGLSFNLIITCKNLYLLKLKKEDLAQYKSYYKEDWPEIRMGERNLSKYKYIVNYYHDIILFNRTSSVNY